MEIIDNFLPPKDFQKIKETCINRFFPLYYADTIVSDEQPFILDNYYFTHCFYHDKKILSEKYFHIIEEHILRHLDVKEIIRCKVNCYPRAFEVKKHGLHWDYDFDHKGLILSLNTCNGGTEFEDGTFVKAVENRALFHNPSIRHSSTTHTDTHCRYNIAINWK